VTPTALVWLVVGLVSLTAVLAVLIALIRHLFVLGRAASRFQAEVSPLAREIGELADTASNRSRRSSSASRDRTADPKRQ
jgi:hypothetical protein